MADFVAVIRRAVDGLSENTPDNRERVYEKARSAVRRQLETMSPRPSDELVRRQLDKLETAIGEVESEHAEALPPLEEDAPEAAAAPAVEAYEQEEPSGWPSEPEARPEPAPRPMARTLPRRPAAEAEPVSSAAAAWGIERSEPADPAPHGWHGDGAAGDERIDPQSLKVPETAEPFEHAPFAEPALLGEAHDEVFGLGDRHGAGRRRSRRGLIRGVAAVVVLLIVCGAAYGLWENSSSIRMMVASVAPSSKDAAPASKPADAKAQTAPAGKEVAKAEAGAGDAGQAKLPEGGKFTQRLMADGSETNPGPAASPDQPTPSEGKSVMAESDQATATTPAASPADSTQNAAKPAEAVKAAGEQAAVSQKMYLYEERFNDQAPAATTGTVVWTVAKDSPGGDAPNEPAIHGEISIPDKGMTALVTIKRNADQSLPASHLIEIVFALPGKFDGGGIDSVQRVSMKETEQSRGDPLIAVPAKITDNFFMVALNDYPKAVQTNLDLLKSRDWIDIPITYKNGRRALITLEKGASGAKVFDEAMKAWAAAPAKAAGGNAPAAPDAPPTTGSTSATPGQ
ncbi:MAG: hypothetical protein ACTHJ3_07850 [Pararhizobium sp.]